MTQLLLSEHDLQVSYHSIPRNKRSYTINNGLEKNNYDISIVMSYWNRKEQTLRTLDGFEILYRLKYSFEVIIVDDNSNKDNYLDHEIMDYNFPIKLVVIGEEEKGSRVNPCLAYNKGFKECKGEIIIIQNPECYHIGDILGYTKNNLKDFEYYSYSCYSANSFEITDQLLKYPIPYTLICNNNFDRTNANIIGLSWYNHPTEYGRQKGYHFCSAIYKSKLDLIGGFDERFADGYCFDDDELVLSIKYNLQLKIKIIHPDENVMVIHQYHERNKSFNIECADDSNPIKQKWLRNKNLLDEMTRYHETKKFNYPKLLHLYWDGNPLSFINLVTVLSFNKYHKFWKINVFMPTKKTDILTWNTNEQKDKYEGSCYLSKLQSIDNVLIHKVDLDELGFYDDASEVIKSDYFRYYILELHGGVWSDFDIVYTASMEDKINFRENAVIFHCVGYHDSINKFPHTQFEYYPIGLLMGIPHSLFFKFIRDNCKKYYNPKEYQCIGASMFMKEFKTFEDIYKIDNIKILDNTYYLPYQCTEVSYLFGENVKCNSKLPSTNIGIHWFNGSLEAKKYANDLDTKLNCFKPICYIDNMIQEYICYDIVINYCNQNSKLNILLENLHTTYKNITLNIHVVTETNIIDIQIYDNINVNYYKNITSAIGNINNNYIFFQDLIILHKEEILSTLMHEIQKSGDDFIGCSKKIYNNRISDGFKQVIQKNKLPDIMVFKKESFVANKFKINETWNQCSSYKLLETDKIYYLFPKNIPKIIHFYWDGSKGDYLTSLTIKSFVFNNPDWSVTVWMPQIKYYDTPIIWEPQENIPPHTMPYNDIDYIDYTYLRNELGVEIKNIEYFDLGLSQNYPEVLKSDIFRWKILYEIGGVWSDMDILFVDRIEKTDFARYKNNFQDIELVVSQYDRDCDGNFINFYYIGFLMSSKNNLFFNIMYNESIKHISSTSYQGVGGDLMKRHFGIFNDIEKIINNNNYVNLQSDSVYHYWWGNLRSLYLDNNQDNIFEYVIKNNNIIGYHWFRGVHLSRIYTHFYNYKNKIQNYNNFKGPLNGWTKYYEEIFNEKNIITNEKKISIVMGYINRLKQLEVTLTTISKSLHTNYEIIIVNDGTEDLSYLHNKFNNLNIIDNSNKEYTNPCISYNLGIAQSTGDIVIIQNPECCHVGDLLSTVNCLLKENDYMVFSSYYLDNYNKNHDLYPILLNETKDLNFWDVNKMHSILKFTLEYSHNSVLNKPFRGWCSHHFYNPNYLHFCTATYKSNLMKLNCFSDEYKDGYCFDDDDLARKVKLSGLKLYYYPIAQYPKEYPTLSEYSVFVIHQHHDTLSYSDSNTLDKWEKNKQLFISENYKYVRCFLESFYNTDIPYNINICNGKVQFTDGKYDIHFNDSFSNTITLNYIFPMNNFEYIFNGKTMMLQNNITELFNNCEFEVTIWHTSACDILVNGISPQVVDNNIYIYNGKIINSKIIVQNLPKIINISFTSKLKKINFVDNTIFTQLSI